MVSELTWFDKGYKAFESGECKMPSCEKGAEYFNEGWEEADRQHYRWEVEEHKDLKKRICGYGESLDLDELVKLLYEMGFRA